MKRAVFDGTHELKLVDVEVPKPLEDEVLIKIDSATICGTDVHILEGSFYAKKGVCIGHEFSGVVEETGENVLVCKKGDLVSVEPHIFCGICKFCRNGKVQQCLNKLAFGVHLDGGFQQYVTVPQNTVYTVPKDVTAEEAALCETVGCCLHGIEQVGIRGGDNVVILGGGTIGIILMKLCRMHGASKVIVSEPEKARRENLLRHGADYVIDPHSEDIYERVKLLTDGLGADVVIEAAGRSQTAKQTFRLAGRCGRIMFFGVVPPGEKIEVEPNDIFKRELTIVGSAINPFAHHRVIQIIKKLQLADLITQRYPLERVNEAIQAASQLKGLKICIKPNI